jgi:hypothetical protein
MKDLPLGQNRGRKLADSAQPQKMGEHHALHKAAIDATRLHQ